MPGRSEKQIYSADEFEIFLDRNITRQVRIPLTKYCLGKNAAIDFSGSGAFISKDLTINNSMNLLVLGMGASNVPFGEWSRYVSGAVQVIIGLDELINKKTINLTDKDKDRVKVLNN